MKSALFTFVICILIGIQLQAQDTVSYFISFPNAAHHEAEISVKIPARSVDVTIINMSKYSPGRYAYHGFAKNIYDLKVYDLDSNKLKISRTAPESWQVSSSGEVLLSYTLYANRADGTFSGIDEDNILLNMPASFVWVDGMEDYPISLTFNFADTSEWKIATQLPVSKANNKYYASNLQYFMDSPCLIGDLQKTSFLVDDADSTEIIIALKATGSEAETDKIKDLTKKIVLEEKAVFGELPNFNNNKYQFLCGYGPGFYADGMEHRNSSVNTSSKPFAGNVDRHIGTLVHEFLHVWNVERLRPASLEPFDFMNASMSGELWFSEGITSYYENLIQCRAGIYSEAKYMNTLSSILNFVHNSPGMQFGSPVEMSEMAALTDRSNYTDDTNFSNTYLSYYVYGSIIGLTLDLEIRSKFAGKSLDDLMRAMWEKFGKSEVPFKNEDIEKVLSEVTGNKDFSSTFFDKYIYDNQMPDFEQLFDRFGYKLIKKNPGKPGFGYARFRFKGDTAVLLSQPLINSSLYESGISKSDLILSIDEQPVTSYPELNFIIGTRKVGDILSMEYAHNGKKKTGRFTVQEDNQIVLIPKERFSMRTDEHEENRKNEWLKSRVRIE